MYGTMNIIPAGNSVICGAELDSAQRPADEKTLAPLPQHDVEMILMEIDPICKMEVDPKTAKWKSNYGGKDFFFCAPGCKKAFDKDPQKYLK